MSVLWSRVGTIIVTANVSTEIKILVIQYGRTENLIPLVYYFVTLPIFSILHRKHFRVLSRDSEHLPDLIIFSTTSMRRNFEHSKVKLMNVKLGRYFRDNIAGCYYNYNCIIVMHFR